MAGSRGTLGITLARTIIPRAVTIDHVAKPLLLQHTSAPKEIEFWIVPEKGRDYTTSMTTASAADLLDDAVDRIQRYRAATLYRIPFIRLANFTYDVHSLFPTQTINIFPELDELQLRTNTVLFRIRSNWGNDAYTCVYRVRVHGDAPED